MSDRFEPCFRCNGIGMIYGQRVDRMVTQDGNTIPFRRAASTTCPRCNGTGSLARVYAKPYQPADRLYA